MEKDIELNIMKTIRYEDYKKACADVPTMIKG